MELVRVCKVKVSDKHLVKGESKIQFLWRDDSDLKFFLGNNPDKLKRITDPEAEHYAIAAIKHIHNTEHVTRRGMLVFLTQRVYIDKAFSNVD